MSVRTPFHSLSAFSLSSPVLLPPVVPRVPCDGQVRGVLQLVCGHEDVIEEVDADEQARSVARLDFADDDLAGEGAEHDEAERHAHVRRAVAAVYQRRAHAVQPVQSDAQTLPGEHLRSTAGNEWVRARQTAGAAEKRRSGIGTRREHRPATQFSLRHLGPSSPTPHRAQQTLLAYLALM